MEFIRLWPGENANSRWRSMDKIIFKAYFSWLCFIVYSEKKQYQVLKIASYTSTNATNQSKLSHWENSARFELYLKMTFSAGSCFAVFCRNRSVKQETGPCIENILFNIHLITQNYVKLFGAFDFSFTDISTPLIRFLNVKRLSDNFFNVSEYRKHTYDGNEKILCQFFYVTVAVVHLMQESFLSHKFFSRFETSLTINPSLCSTDCCFVDLCQNVPQKYGNFCNLYWSKLSIVPSTLEAISFQKALLKLVK